MKAACGSMLAAGTLFMSATMAQAALTDNLIAHFQFENNLNSSGSVVLAAPSVTGTPTYEAGQDPYFGNALRLPGASGFYVQYDSDTTPLSLTGGTSYTVSFQFRLEGNSGQHSDRIFATDGGDAPGLNAWGMRIDNAANNRQFHWRHGGNPEHASGTPLELDRWYNVAVVYDADTDWLRVIVDGKVVNAVQPTPDITHASDLRIGNYAAGGTQGASGLLDELRIYDRALSFTLDGENNVIGGEIAELFAIPEPASIALMGFGAMLTLSRRRRRD